MLGFSEQWTAPSKRSPWRYGGAVRPAHLAAAAKDAMIRRSSGHGGWCFAEEKAHRVHPWRVKIVNRKKLEDSACECYGVIQQFDGELGLK